MSKVKKIAATILAIVSMWMGGEVAITFLGYSTQPENSIMSVELLVDMAAYCGAAVFLMGTFLFARTWWAR